MADFTVNSPRGRGAARPGGALEYRLYFAVMFILALPFALLAYFWAVTRHARIPDQGPLARARAEAHLIVPMIFRG